MSLQSAILFKISCEPRNILENFLAKSMWIRIKDKNKNEIYMIFCKGSFSTRGLNMLTFFMNPAQNMLKICLSENT